MSRRKRLLSVFDVANAQKQGAERVECIETRYATMFQERAPFRRAEKLKDLLSKIIIDNPHEV